MGRIIFEEMSRSVKPEESTQNTPIKICKRRLLPIKYPTFSGNSPRLGRKI
jgi:hypothetical protein